MPFADYADFDDCVSKNSNKDNPEAYCADLKKQAGETIKRDNKGREIIAENVPIIFSSSIGVKNE